MMCCLLFFFKQKTAYEMRISDWSSDVCSSDLDALEIEAGVHITLVELVFIEIADCISALIGTGEEFPVDPRFQKFTVGQPNAGHYTGRGQNDFAAFRDRDFFDRRDFDDGHMQIGRASCRESVCKYV